MNVYLFHSQAWHLVGELLSTANQSHSARAGTGAAALHSDSRFEFSYSLEYAKNFFDRDNNFALSSLFPVRLMEVFRSPQTEQWLQQFYPLDAANIEPNQSVGNVIVTSERIKQIDLIESDGFPVTQLLEHSQTMHSGQINALGVGYAGGYPYWFIATDGKNAFPTRAIEVNPALVPVMLPISVESRFGQSIHLHFNREEQAQYIAIIKAISQHCDNNCESQLEQSGIDQISRFALPRYDIVKTAWGYEYLGVENLKTLFRLAYSESENLLQFLKRVVSTYKHAVSKFGDVDHFVVEILKRDLILRLFDSAFSITEIDILKSERGYALAPLTMQIFATHGARVRTNNAVFDWPYPVCIDNQLDYPLLCDALSEVIDPHSILLELSEFSEKLLNITKGVYHPTSATKNAVILSEKIAAVDQKLTRWGLLM